MEIGIFLPDEGAAMLTLARAKMVAMMLSFILVFVSIDIDLVLLVQMCLNRLRCFV